MLIKKEKLCRPFAYPVLNSTQQLSAYRTSLRREQFVSVIWFGVVWVLQLAHHFVDLRYLLVCRLHEL